MSASPERPAAAEESGDPAPSIERSPRDVLRATARRSRLALVGLIVSGLLVLLFGLTIGPMNLSPADVFEAIRLRLTGAAATDVRGTTAAVVILDIRLPRMMAAAIVGAALSTSGAAFQAVFANPLVSPGILGVLAGAAFGAALAILNDLAWPIVQASSFVFGIGASGFALLLARGVAGNGVLALVLGGIVSGALFTALVSLVKMVADPTSQLPAIVFWLMGSLSHVTVGSLAIAAPFMLAAILALSMYGRSLDLLAMGDEEAASLGLRVKRLRIVAILLATLAGSLSVSLAGIVGWVGLIVPHVARGLFGSMNRRVLPASAALGAVFLMVVDTTCRSLLSAEIPLGIATALIGIPFLAVLMRWGVGRGWH